MADLNSSLPVVDTSDGTLGSTAPTIGTQIAGKDLSGNLQTIRIDAQNGLLIAGEGTAGANVGGVLTIQGNASGIAVPVSGTFFQATQPISGTVAVSSLPSIPAGTNTIGSITNTSFGATQSGTWNVTNISGTVSLPTGAATSANQATEITSLSSIVTNTSNTNTSIQNVQGSVTPGTAATKSDLVAGIYESAGITLTNGQQAALQLTSSGALNVNLASGAALEAAQTYSNYQPAPDNVVTGVGFLATDAVGRLEGHSAVYSDEGSFRDDFPGTSLITTLTGTVTFTNGSTAITGVGTSFSTQVVNGNFLKKSTDSETLYVQVSRVNSDTSITLSSNYAGTTASTTSVASRWATTTPTGGSIAVASSMVNIASGTTNGQVGTIQAYGDYLPYTLNVYAAISQRIVNQTTVLGFMDVNVNPTKQAIVQFIGTNNTQVNFVTASSAAAVDIQTTTITLPNGGVTSGYHIYKIDLSANQASLSIDGVLVATQSNHIPGPYDVLNIVGQTTNTGTAASSTTLAIDYYYFSNWDRLQIDDDFNGEPLTIGGVAPSGQSNMGNPVKVSGAYNSTLPTIASGQVADIQVDSNGRQIISPLTTTTLINVNAIPTDGSKASYSAAILGLTVANNPTDIFTLYGSASKVVRITKIEISATQNTSTIRDIQLIKRSANNTAGSSTAQTAVPHDSTNSSATTTVLAYTANPTSLGAAVGTLRAVKMGIDATNITNPTDKIIWDFGNRPSQAIVLRGTTQGVAINLNAITSATNSFDIDIEWTEE